MKRSRGRAGAERIMQAMRLVVYRYALKKEERLRREKVQQEYELIVRKLARWSRLGETVASNNARLIGHIPHVGPVAYLHTIFPGLTAEQIAELEGTIGRSIPGPYREFLAFGNGMKCFQELTCDGLRLNYSRDPGAARLPFHLQDANVYERPRNTPEDVVFIGGYCYDASNVYMRLGDPRVYHCPRRSFEPILNVWPDLYTWLSTEIDRLAGLFDQQGRLIDEAKPTMPEPNMVRADGP